MAEAELTKDEGDASTELELFHQRRRGTDAGVAGAVRLRAIGDSDRDGYLTGDLLGARKARPSKTGEPVVRRIRNQSMWRNFRATHIPVGTLPSRQVFQTTLQNTQK